MEFYISCSEISMAQKSNCLACPLQLRTVTARITYNLITKVGKVNRF